MEGFGHAIGMLCDIMWKRERSPTARSTTSRLCAGALALHRNGSASNRWNLADNQGILSFGIQSLYGKIVRDDFAMVCTAEVKLREKAERTIA